MGSAQYSTCSQAQWGRLALAAPAVSYYSSDAAGAAEETCSQAGAWEQEKLKEIESIIEENYHELTSAWIKHFHN